MVHDSFSIKYGALKSVRSVQYIRHSGLQICDEIAENQFSAQQPIASHFCKTRKLRLQKLE